MKVCSKCQQELPLERFHRLGGGHRGQCKDCRAIQYRIQAPSINQRFNAQQRRLRAAQDERGKRNLDLKKRYGITIEEFEAMLASQGGGCKACGTTEFKGSGRRPHIDHCHQTGRIRALLCNSCNLAFGQLGEDPEKIYKLYLYAIEQDMMSQPHRSKPNQTPSAGSLT